MKGAPSRLLLLPALAILVGCSATGPSSAPSPSGSAAVASPSSTPATEPIPLRPDRILLEDPAIELTLPVGWREVTVEEWTKDIEGLGEGASLIDPAFRARLEDGQVLTTAEGFTERALYVLSEIRLIRGSTSMDEAMARFTQAVTRSWAVEDIETGGITSPFGEISRARYVLKPAGDTDTAASVQLMAYAVPVGPEGMLVIHSFGQRTDSSHPALLDEMMSTLDINNGLSLAIPSRPWVGSVDGTNVSYVYPDTFLPVPLDGLRDSYAELLTAGALVGPEVERTVDAIDARTLRAQITSQKPLGVGRFISIMVYEDVDDLDSAIARVLEGLGDPDILSRAEVQLPIGDAARLRLSAPGTEIPAIDELYVLPLDDGTSLTIKARGAEEDADFHGIVSAFAQSLKHR